ncbi:MAG TPA: VacJ family lipoprotein [Xanthomonadales bacterium]|nr:VacJ family lipoprotein [Xanthomonadales bacterium]
MQAVIEQDRSKRVLQSTILVLCSLLLSACATQPTTLTDPERDPWEGFNRKTHAFNTSVDNAVFKPVARGYDRVMPDGPQRGVRNFFNNLNWPVDFVNLILQGRIRDSITETGRFLVNSTIGLGGFFDVATRSGYPDFNEDLGQTMAVWGWKKSNYLVLPFLGPRTVRDTFGRSLYGYLSPVTYYAREKHNYVPLVIDLISLRAELLPLEQDIQGAEDPYVLIRDVYLQRREFEIYNGNPPSPDYDALLEDYE